MKSSNLPFRVNVLLSVSPYSFSLLSMSLKRWPSFSLEVSLMSKFLASSFLIMFYFSIVFSVSFSATTLSTLLFSSIHSGGHTFGTVFTNSNTCLCVLKSHVLILLRHLPTLANALDIESTPIKSFTSYSKTTMSQLFSTLLPYKLVRTSSFMDWRIFFSLSSCKKRLYSNYDLIRLLRSLSLNS